MPEWRDLTLGDLCAEAGGSIQTGPFGSQLHASDYVDVGTPSVMPQNIGDNRIIDEGIAMVSKADAERLDKHRLVAGDIVYSRRGDVERRALVRSENEGWLCGTGCLRVRIGNDAVHDARFISYYLGAPDSRAWVVRHAVGATMLNLNTSILSAVPMRIPGLPKQKAIAEVLGALDDKIAANDRLLGALDDLVRTRYSSLAAGSPVRLESIALNVRNQVNPTSVDPSFQYVGLEHINRRHSWLRSHGRPQDVESAKSAFLAGDVLFGKLRSYFHKVAMAGYAGICSTDILVLRSRDPELRGFVLAAASADQTVASVSASAHGTRMPRASWAALGAVEVPWPGESSARAFSAEVANYAELARAAADESASLAQARDELLPLLVSGTVRVKDAEKVVEEVP